MRGDGTSSSPVKEAAVSASVAPQRSIHGMRIMMVRIARTANPANIPISLKNLLIVYSSIESFYSHHRLQTEKTPPPLGEFSLSEWTVHPVAPFWWRQRALPT